MSLEYLYREIIMDHYKSPKNKGLINDKDYLLVNMHNPSCGDDVTVQFKLENNVIKNIRHDGTGCSICCASASVMSETLINKEKEEALKLIQRFYDMLTDTKNDVDLIGDMIAFKGVGKFPARIRCATLAWQGIEKGLKEGE